MRCDNSGELFIRWRLNKLLTVNCDTKLGTWELVHFNKWGSFIGELYFNKIKALHWFVFRPPILNHFPSSFTYPNTWVNTTNHCLYIYNQSNNCKILRFLFCKCAQQNKTKQNPTMIWILYLTSTNNTRTPI